MIWGTLPGGQHSALELMGSTSNPPHAVPTAALPGSPSYRLAILHDPENPESPSNAAAIQKFLQAAARQGLQVELITPDDFERLPQFDALFIRDTTYTNHYTYLFSSRAADEGLAVIDDPNSILKCNNKALQAQLFARRNIPTPRTLVVHRRNVKKIIPSVGLPCVLKLPDSSFSRGVIKVETEAELQQQLKLLFEKSKLIVAQEFMPTAFDWRIGILDRKPFFACRYLMVPGYWQIIKHEADGSLSEGATIALPLEEAPQAVVQLALKAANLIGDGFYGVDVKEVGEHHVVIEINDNPNVDAGNEDGVLGDELYRRIIASLLRRIRERKSK
jgi:glutathione synthase/RimK-type ligase-like ATP-grasp enzyme